MSRPLEDQVAIVTGAAQGIGKAIARQLVSSGVSVVLADIQADKVTETAAELANIGRGATTVGLPCDVSSLEDTEVLVGQTLDQFNRIDILVNNAGIGVGNEFEDLTHDDWQKVLDVNLTGPFNCSKSVIPTMIEQEYGRIINISSMAGRNISYHGSANYTASKWGLIGLTKHMAWDLGKYNITVNAVCPGSTLTPLIESATSRGDREKTTSKIPLQRWASPDDQAEGVMYLVSESGSYVTGTVLEIDGGKQLGVRHEI